MSRQEQGGKEESSESSRMMKIQVGVGVALLLITVVPLALGGLRRLPGDQPWLAPGGSVQRGKQAIQKYGCGSCHTVPGVPGATAHVGPLLTDVKRKGFLAGRLPNVPHFLVFWIRDPQRYEPGTAMPNLNVTESDAKDIAAYLYSVSE